VTGDKGLVVPAPAAMERHMVEAATNCAPVAVPANQERVSKIQKSPVKQTKTDQEGRLNPFSIPTSIWKSAFKRSGSATPAGAGAQHAECAEPRAGAPVEGQGATAQGELSLDSVKVVRNDLTDGDVELVPIKSRTGALEPSQSKKPWEFLGQRFFGVEST